MIKGKNKAFTKKWALFCVGKHDTARDFSYKNKIIRGEDFRFGEFDRAGVRFCSVLHTNLSDSRIQKGGDFVGNGWDSCNFSGICYNEITVEMDQYEHCVMGNASFHHMLMLEIQARDCNYAGSLWDNTEFQGCVFEKCNFRKARFRNGRMDKTLFLDCVFDETVLEGIKRSDVIFRNCLLRGWVEEWMEGCIFQDCTFENC